MSKAAKKRLNRFLRMSGRTLANANNAQQHLQSRRFARDRAEGGEEQLEQMARQVIAQAKADDDALLAAMERELGVWG